MRINLVKTETGGAEVADYVPPNSLKHCPNSTTVLIGINGLGQWIARAPTALTSSAPTRVEHVLFKP